MAVKDVHGLDCSQCKLCDEFYETFNSDSKKNVSYFGVISYINHVRPVSSDKTKEFSNGQNHMNSNICLIQIKNEWTIRDMISKRMKQNNGPIDHFNGENYLYPSFFRKKNTGPRPSFYQPEHTGNLIVTKVPSFSKPSPSDTVCSDSLEVTKEDYKCKLTKTSPKRKNGGPQSVSYTKKMPRVKQDPTEKASKEPKVGTLKRKRCNWGKKSKKCMKMICSKKKVQAQ